MKTVRLWCENPRESSQNSSLLFQDPSLLFAILKNALKNIFIYQNHSSIVFRTRLLYFSTLIITPQNPSIFNPQNPFNFSTPIFTHWNLSLLVRTHINFPKTHFYSLYVFLLLRTHVFNPKKLSFLLTTHFHIFTTWNLS